MVNVIHSTNITAVCTASWAISGAVTVALLSNPLGAAGGAICSGVGFLASHIVRLIASKQSPNSGSLFSLIALKTFVVAAGILALTATIWALAPFWGVQMTLLGSFVFSSVASAIGSIITDPILALISGCDAERMEQLAAQ